MKETKKAVRGSGRVSFLARLDAIKKMIEEGHPLLSIYQEYEKDFGFSYSQFVKYVHKFIRSKPTNEIKLPETRKEAAPRKAIENEEPAFKQSGKRDNLFEKPK